MTPFQVRVQLGGGGKLCLRKKKNKKFSTNNEKKTRSFQQTENKVLLTCIILKFYIQLNYKIFNQRAA